MEYLKGLNEKQLEAVYETEGYLRVIAGAGSGKTKVLVSRYAYLVKEYGIDTANILCVTFTNKAAGEMKRRIRSFIGSAYDTSLICTYHGFCVRVLREDIEKIFYPKEFRIIDKGEQKAILGEIYQKFELKLDHASFEKILSKIQKFKALNPWYVEKMCLGDKCQILLELNELDDRIIEEYLQRQKQIYAMDFNDLLYFTLDIFERCPEVLEKWQEKLNYIQVDEFQDSSGNEMKLVDLLSGKHGNLMIVGDPDQNIYEWRGSDVKLLVDFDKHHSPTKTVFLNQNYRSTPQILHCANTLIEKNKYRLEKELFTKSDCGTEVYHYHTKNEFAEAEKICECISQIKKETNCNFADFAVIYRSGFLSRVIEKKFTENGIPYEIFGGVKFYQRMEIQDIMAYLRLVAFDDDISFKRIINTPRRKFGRVKMQRLVQLQNDGETLFEALKNNLLDEVLGKSSAKSFIDMIESIRARENRLKVSEIVEEICDKSGYEKYIKELGDMERFDNLSEFKRIASEFEKNFGEEVSLKEFINQISLQSEEDGEENCDMVKLMTIHASKGLEFPNVFIVGFSEGIFPSAKTIEERKDMGLEEERRLCYVAITRAEKRLFLLDSEGYTQNGKQKLPSRFLKEIGEQNYIRVGTISKELQDSADDFARQLSGEIPIETTERRIGDRVVHPAFGEGEIVDICKNGASYKIKFDKLNSERDISSSFFNKKRDIIPQKVEEKVYKSDIPNINEGYEPMEAQKIETQKTIESQSIEKFDSFEPKARQNIIDNESPNLWKHDDVPKSDWVCVGVTDLGYPCGICQMCGNHQVIRYVHHMVHSQYGQLDVGCICAGKMEGDIEKAKARERDLKNRQARKENFRNRNWKTSKNNNSYLKINEHLVVIYYNKKYDNWKYSLDNVFGVEVFNTKEEAIDGAFEALESL